MEIILIAVESADGFITRHDEPGAGFASEADQRHFRKALGEFDVGVCGSETYLTAREQIQAGLAKGRRRVVLTRRPERFATDAVPGLLEFTAESPRVLAGRLETAGCRRCALLGGAQIHSLFLEAGLVDELWLTVEPRLFGAGTPLLRGITDTRLRLLGVERLEGGDTLLVKYSVRR